VPEAAHRKLVADFFKFVSESVSEAAHRKLVADFPNVVPESVTDPPINRSGAENSSKFFEFPKYPGGATQLHEAKETERDIEIEQERWTLYVHTQLSYNKGQD
jgi:hypothetical protein